MPTINGIYVKLDNLTVNNAVTRMGNYIRQGQDKRSVILSKVIQKMALDDSDKPALLKLYDTARRMSNAATRLSQPHNRVPRPGEAPTIPGPSGKSGKFQYEILITTTDSNGNITSTTRAFAYYDTPQSLDNVRTDVLMQGSIYRNQRTSPGPNATQSSDDAVRTIVLSFGVVK